MDCLVNAFGVGINIPGYLGPLSPRHLLSLVFTRKRNDVGSRGRGLPASAATLSRGGCGRVPKMILGVNHSRAIVTGIFPRIYDKGNIHRNKGNRLSDGQTINWIFSKRCTKMLHSKTSSSLERQSETTEAAGKASRLNSVSFCPHGLWGSNVPDLARSC